MGPAVEHDWFLKPRRVPAVGTYLLTALYKEKIVSAKLVVLILLHAGCRSHTQIPSLTVAFVLGPNL